MPDTTPLPAPTLLISTPSPSDASDAGAVARLVAAVRRPAGRLRRALLGLWDGALHPLRRRRARARLRALPRPRNVVFLCLGNVCRSPYAEYRFRALAVERGARDLTVVSAGFIGPGRPPADLALAQARDRGLDTSAHRSRVVEAAMLHDAELVVLVDPGHGVRLRRVLGRHGVATVVLGDLDPEPVDRRTIRDPWGEDPVVYDRVFQRLDRCLDELAALTLPAHAGAQAEKGEP